MSVGKRHPAGCCFRWALWVYLDTSWEISPPFCLGREINPTTAVAERGLLTNLTQTAELGGQDPAVFSAAFFNWLWQRHMNMDVHMNDATLVVLYLEHLRRPTEIKSHTSIFWKLLKWGLSMKEKWAEARQKGPPCPVSHSWPCCWVLRMIIDVSGCWQVVLLILVGRASLLSSLQGLFSLD